MLLITMKKLTKITLQNTKEKCKRKNAEANNKLHWFASKFSIYFSYFFLKLRFSADQVTIIFFVVGLLGSFLYSFDSLILSVLGYAMFRLHIIIDMSDGDVARFNKSYSIRGAYWDAVIHSIVNPLYYVFISYSFYLQFNNENFMILGALAGVSSSVLMAVKNNYYKAMLFNNEILKAKKEINSQNKSLKFKLFFLVTEFLSIEGFIFLTILVRFLDVELLALILIPSYIGANVLISGIKFYQLSYKGSYKMKS